MCSEGAGQSTKVAQYYMRPSQTCWVNAKIPFQQLQVSNSSKWFLNLSVIVRKNFVPALTCIFVVALSVYFMDIAQLCIKLTKAHGLTLKAVAFPLHLLKAVSTPPCLDSRWSTDYLSVTIPLLITKRLRVSDYVSIASLFQYVWLCKSACAAFVQK